MPQIIVIAHNIRSTYNVGSIFRTCEGFGVAQIVLSGYTPAPSFIGDTRLPHIAAKLTRQIHKTALDAETLVPFVYQEKPDLAKLRLNGFRLVALEQAETSITLKKYHSPEKVALLLGEEVHGITADLLHDVDDIIEIPMVGKKESFNVSVAAGIALYALSDL